MTFKAGQEKTGGRVAGTPNKTTQISRQLAMPFADEAMQALVDVMRNPESPPQAIVSAANSILDRAFGKPRQEVEHSGDAAQPLEILIRHFTDIDAQPETVPASHELGQTLGRGKTGGQMDETVP